MVTITNISVMQAMDYYTADDYYARTITREDYWYGNGLNTSIASPPLSTTTSNSKQKNMNENEFVDVLNRQKKEATSTTTTKIGIDLTFSPPKSVVLSILFRKFIGNRHSRN